MSATIYDAVFESGFSRLLIDSLPFNCASGSSKRTLMPVGSSVMSLCATVSAFSASSISLTVAWSILMFDLFVDTCTAGTSGKKLGSVYSVAVTSATMMMRYFHSG